MAEFKTVPFAWTTVVSANIVGSGEFNPTTGWMNAADLAQGRVTFEVASTSDATGIIKPRFQTANSENAPDGATVIASVATQQGNGVCYPTGLFDISSNMAGKQLVRLGFYFLASAASLKATRVMGRWEIKKC